MHPAGTPIHTVVEAAVTTRVNVVRTEVISIVRRAIFIFRWSQVNSAGIINIAT